MVKARYIQITVSPVDRIREGRSICHGAIIRILIIDVERSSSCHLITGVTTASPKTGGGILVTVPLLVGFEHLPVT